MSGFSLGRFGGVMKDTRPIDEVALRQLMLIRAEDRNEAGRSVPKISCLHSGHPELRDHLANGAWKPGRTGDGLVAAKFTLGPETLKKSGDDGFGSSPCNRHKSSGCQDGRGNRRGQLRYAEPVPSEDSAPLLGGDPRKLVRCPKGRSDEQQLFGYASILQPCASPAKSALA
jgi:hypothetical protein